MRLPSLLALVALLPACAASTAQVDRANSASYQTDRATVFAQVKAAIEADYELGFTNEADGIVESKWKMMKTDLDRETAMADQDHRTARAGFHFRARVVISKSGPPWQVVVDGIAGEQRPGMALMYEFKHGLPDEPAWVQARIDALKVKIYESLKSYAVDGKAHAEPVTATAAAEETAEPATDDRSLAEKCDAGVADACGLAGQELLQGASADPARGITLLTKACDLGNAASCGVIGYAHTAGMFGVTADPAKGATLYEKACTGGDVNSCGNLAGSYAQGRGVKQDYAKARELYGPACDQGIAHACFGLGQLLAQGLGGPKDAAKGKELIAKACAAGNQAACQAK